MNGQTVNDNQNARAGDQDWVFLAEISLAEFLASIYKGDERKQVSLEHLCGELEIPTECLSKLEQVLAAFAREAAVRFKQEKVAFPVSFRLFCQKRMIDEQMIGGWSYFLIERARGPAKSRLGFSQHFINLYVYQEGN